MGIHRPTTPTPPKNTPSFPAKAGIHRPTTPTPQKTLRHSPQRRESIVPLPQRPKKHSVIPRKGGNPSSHYPNAPKNTPSFPQRRESIVPLLQRPKNTPSFPRRRESTIPAHAGIQRKHSWFPCSCVGTCRLLWIDCLWRDYYAFPRRSVGTRNTIPAKAEIHHPTTPTPKKTLRHSRKGGNPSSHYSNAQKTLRHSREGGNPQFPRTREFNENIIQTDQTHHFHTEPPQHHSREGRNSPPHYPNAQKNTPSFPRRRESIVPLLQRPKKHSVIPAKTGIHRPTTPTPKKTLRHSREGGNPSSHYPNAQKNSPSFPRRRESIVPLPQRPKKLSVIPAKAGIHRPTTPTPKKTLRHSREGGNPSSHYPNAQKNSPSFPRRRESIVPLPQRPKKLSVIPAKAGIHCTIYHATLHPGTQGADIYTGLSCCINNSLVRLNR